MKGNRFIKKLFLLIFAVLFLLYPPSHAFAEGSKSMLRTAPAGDLPPGALPFRPYTEWRNGSYAGMLRHQVIKVYAKSGETIFFGSSTYQSTAAGGSGRDIKMTAPSGTSTYYDVIQNGNGHIRNLAQEAAGPQYTDSGVQKNSGGYTPFSVSVTQTGVYLFEFYNQGAHITTNPTPIGINQEWPTQPNVTYAGTAAWDITVVKDLNTGNSMQITGRTFCNYLCLITGEFFLNKITDWGKGLYAVVYVLTDDGYIYKTDFNGMDPNGFLFFANKRGLINPENNSSLYRSARNKTNSDALDNLAVKFPEGNEIKPIFHLPSAPDTAID